MRRFNSVPRRNRPVGGTLMALLLAASCSNEPSPASGSAPGPTESAQPAVTVLGDCHEEMCEGPLERGRYRSTFSDPIIEFEVTSPGWSWVYAGTLGLVADPSHRDLYAADGIYFLRNPAIASQDCEETEEPNVGRSVDALVGWLETAPGLVVTPATPVTVGGLEGKRLDIELDPAWKETCFFSQDLPVVPAIFNGAESGGYNWSVLPGMSMHWYLLETANGVLVVDVENGPDGLSEDELFSSAEEIVESLAFSSS